jgi:hypothetical protein
LKETDVIYLKAGLLSLHLPIDTVDKNEKLRQVKADNPTIKIWRIT